MQRAVLRDYWTERPRRLDPPTESDYGRRIFQTVTRRELDDLTREIWRMYARGEAAQVNATALDRLTAWILATRDILAKNNPR